MEKKVGRNDPCPCGSGKKFKQCCWGKEPPKRQLKASWINQPKAVLPDLLKRTFADAMEGAGDNPPEIKKSFDKIKEKLKKQVE